MRPEPLLSLLESVRSQSQYPDEIIIVDGSTDDATEDCLKGKRVKNLNYYKVNENNRGLTKQRNYGVARVSETIDIVCFLDDDIILEVDYFFQILQTYQKHPEAIGVGGFITNEVSWENVKPDEVKDSDYFYFDGYKRKESSRYKLRNKLGLTQKLPPGWYPEFGHGRSIGFLPSSGEIYEVELLMGGVSSFPLSILKSTKFSEYFEGYGLYEDADFTLRLSKKGKLFVNTAARLEHHHDAAGRPNKYNYGKMVVRNGWYVWRVKHPNPSFSAKIKWYKITMLLIAIRLTNIVTTKKRKEAFTESLGRLGGLFSLFLRRPKGRIN